MLGIDVKKIIETYPEMKYVLMYATDGETYEMVRSWRKVQEKYGELGKSIGAEEERIAKETAPMS